MYPKAVAQGYSKHDVECEDVRIFLSEVALSVIEHNLDQDAGLLSPSGIL